MTGIFPNDFKVAIISQIHINQGVKRIAITTDLSRFCLQQPKYWRA
jgi:hypothetical protein